MTADILLLGELRSGKSAFINMLLGVSLLPDETELTDLPVIRLQANKPAGIWLKQTNLDFTTTPLDWWKDIPNDWESFEQIDVTIEGHQFFDTGIVLWDAPSTNSPSKHQQEYLHAFLSARESIFSTVLFIVPGKLTLQSIDFLKQWPALLERMTIVINILERKSENECLQIEASVKEVAKRELNGVPVQLINTGDVFEEFHILSNEMRPNYSDAELVNRWKEIRANTDGMARKYNSKKTGAQLSELIEKTVKWEDVDYEAVAESVLRMYADNSVPGAQYELGKRLMRQQDFQGAVKYFRMLADRNHGDAMYALSQCYFEGKGVVQNNEAGVSWARAAAEAGVAEAQYRMFMLLTKGEHVKQNTAQAIVYLKMAAYSHHVHACGRLGELHLAGIDIPVNYEMGVKYLSLAVEGGDADAMVALAASYKKGYGVRKDAVEMYRLLERAAALNQPDALVALGDAYLHGIDVQTDKGKAFKYFMRAVDAGASDAQMRVGACYENGDGVAADPAMAVLFYTKAAENGEVEAQYRLGTAYHTGAFGPKDKEKAKHWLQLALHSGEMKAQELLDEIETASSKDANAENRGKCFVVTAAFGDAEAPEVIFFRTFRDTVLVHHLLGKIFIRMYYRHGPALAMRLAQHRFWLAVTRRGLLRLQRCLQTFFP